MLMLTDVGNGDDAENDDDADNDDADAEDIAQEEGQARLVEAFGNCGEAGRRSF